MAVENFALQLSAFLTAQGYTVDESSWTPTLKSVWDAWFIRRNQGAATYQPSLTTLPKVAVDYITARMYSQGLQAEKDAYQAKTDAIQAADQLKRIRYNIWAKAWLALLEDPNAPIDIDPSRPGLAFIGGFQNFPSPTLVDLLPENRGRLVRVVDPIPAPDGPYGTGPDDMPSTGPTVRAIRVGIS